MTNLPGLSMTTEHHYIELPSGTIYYEEQGAGQPVIFLHGVWCSSRFFRPQLEGLHGQCRAIAMDFRGHGRSAMTPSGHTVHHYALDLHDFIHQLGLKDPVLVGWSMGAMVVWEYVKQFGDRNIKGAAIVEQGACDFRYDDHPEGPISLEVLREWMQLIQTDRNSVSETLIGMMLHQQPQPQDFDWMIAELTQAPESIASAIFFDQALRDFRDVVMDFPVPTIICWGADESMLSIESGRKLARQAKRAEFVLFENSNHMPHIEEPEKFNEVISKFVHSLN